MSPTKQSTTNRIELVIKRYILKNTEDNDLEGLKVQAKGEDGTDEDDEDSERTMLTIKLYARVHQVQSLVTNCWRAPCFLKQS